MTKQTKQHKSKHANAKKHTHKQNLKQKIITNKKIQTQ